MFLSCPGTEHTRQSAQPSFLAGGLSFFGGGAANLDRHLSSLDQRIGAQHGDAEAGMEMDSFGKVEGRRSSSMVEKDTDVVEGAELFDLGSFFLLVQLFKPLQSSLSASHSLVMVLFIVF
jgi:hypothetical protein